MGVKKIFHIRVSLQKPVKAINSKYVFMRSFRFLFENLFNSSLKKNKFELDDHSSPFAMYFSNTVKSTKKSLMFLLYKHITIFDIHF